MKNTRRIALCGILAALAEVILILGAALGIGIYAGPMFAGICLLPAGWEYSRKDQWLLFACVSLLSLFLVTDAEEKLIFIGLLGWYPIVRPLLEKLKKPLRVAVKLILFNVIVIALETLVMLVLVPEAESPAMLAVLLALGNAAFFLYDRLLPRFELLYILRLRKLLHIH